MRHPVIIIQGFGAPTFTNLPIKARLIRDGFQAHDAALRGFNVKRIEESSAVVAEKVAEIVDQGHDQIDLIGVSMGGLIGLHYLRKRDGAKNVRKFIALGAPFYGTPAAKLARILYGRRANAAGQMAEDSDFMRDLHKNDGNDSCEIISILARGRRDGS